MVFKRKLIISKSIFIGGAMVVNDLFVAFGDFTTMKKFRMVIYLFREAELWQLGLFRGGTSLGSGLQPNFWHTVKLKVGSSSDYIV